MLEECKLIFSRQNKTTNLPKKKIVYFYSALNAILVNILNSENFKLYTLISDLKKKKKAAFSFTGVGGCRGEGGDGYSRTELSRKTIANGTRQKRLSSQQQTILSTSPCLPPPSFQLAHQAKNAFDVLTSPERAPFGHLSSQQATRAERTVLTKNWGNCNSRKSAIVQEVGSIKHTETAFLAKFKILVKHEQHFSASISRAVFGK